jgi:hypothetical protein
MALFKTDISNIAGVALIGTTALRVVHVHKHDSDDPADWDWSSSDVTSLTCDPFVATQRRRLR